MGEIGREGVGVAWGSFTMERCLDRAGDIVAARCNSSYALRWLDMGTACERGDISAACERGDMGA